MIKILKKVSSQVDYTQIQYLKNFLKYSEKINRIQLLKVLLLHKRLHKLTNSLIYFYIFFCDITKKVIEKILFKKLKI